MVRDQTIGQQMVRVFSDDLRYSQEVTIEQFRRRSWFERLAEQAAQLITRVLLRKS